MEQIDLRERAMTLEFWRDLLLVLTLAIVGLVYGAGFLVPLTFSLLVVILLMAVIDRVGSLRIGGRAVPRLLAHIVGMALVLLGFTVIGLILTSQADQVAEAVPRYAARFETMATGLVVLVGEQNAQQMRAALQNADLSSWVLGLLGSAGGLIKGFFLVLLYVPFLMVEQVPLARKTAIAAPDRKTGEELRRMVQSISRGLQRYLGVKTFVSVLTGLASYAVMKPMGLDFAETWAVLAFALNFIPSIGSILGVVFPALVALVQYDTITPFLVIVVLCGTLQFSIGNILEPAITGRSLNLSPFLVILSLTFWTAIWGAAGALLSVPIMVGFLIVFTHIPRLRWIAVLMSRDGDLTALDEERFIAERVKDGEGTEHDR